MTSSPETLRDLIAAAARERPDAPAILAPGLAPTSYARLLELVDGTRRALAGMGLGRSDRVALVQPNGPQAATAFLAVAGGAVCAPLNPAYGETELEFFLGDLDARAVIVQEGLDSPAAGVAERLGAPVVRLRPADDAGAGWFELQAGTVPASTKAAPASADDVALVLHTSGTTSRPKQVPLRHRNLCASAANIRECYALTPADRCLNVMPLFHIHGLVGALLSTLAAGGSVACTPGFVATRFFAWLDEVAPTWYTAVPTMHQAILARAGAHAEIIRRRPLRLIRSCSSPLPPQVMLDLEAAMGAPVLEAYGMTEASHQIASNPPPPRGRKPGSVGCATGCAVVVLSADGEPVATGGRGEIAIRGDNVTSGYEGPEELNRAAFRAGWFRTGDQGYVDEDGYVFLTGRLKELINRGGEKIAPREIDEALLEHPGVAEALTFAVPHAQLGEEIGAAVVLRPGAGVSEADLREHVARRLAAFKVPRVVRILEAIPKGPTGKPQRIGLAQRLGIAPLDHAHAATEGGSEAPRSALEARLAAIWRQVLDRDDLGVHDDFFALGGDSILAVSLLDAVFRETGVKLSSTALLEAPTVAAMAVRLAAEPAGRQRT
jgi:acyl-CoA synthetase (AMP-forming)/AMP-acid ligase II/aryl carrier-like protein